MNEYYNNIVNCSLPVANTGADIASTLKYFSQTLLSILKETNLDESALADNTADPLALDSSCVSLVSKIQQQNDSAQETGSNDTKSGPNLLALAESSNSFGIIVNQPVSSLTKDSDEDKLYSNRIKKFPNLNYSTLYHSLLNIIEIIPMIQISQIGSFRNLK